MWKVKRMNTARIVDMTNANGAGGTAAFLASGSANQPHFINPRGEDVSAVGYGAAGRQAVET